MVKAALRDLVRSRLLQVDKTAKYHNEVIDAWITMAFNQLLGQLFRKSLGNFDLYVKRYNNVSILQDADTDIYYCDLPAPIVQTIDVAEGVRRINTMKGRGIEFAPISGDSLQILTGIDVNLITDVVGYRVFSDRVEFQWIPAGMTEVRMELVVPFTEYEDEDDVKIPGGGDAQLMEIILNFVMNITPRDLKNDNSDKAWTQQAQ